LPADQGALAIAFFSASAILVTLFLYLLLYRSLPERFFRLWTAGWVLFAGYGVLRFLSYRQGSVSSQLLTLELSLSAMVLFLASVLDDSGRSRYLPWLWGLAALGGVAMVIQVVSWPGVPAALWGRTMAQSALLLAAGWAAWTGPRRETSLGRTLLAGAFLLCGLHRMDYPNWAGQSAHVIRLSFDGLLEVAMGIAMVVLILEDTRARTESLNEKLRRLTLITTAATQTLRTDEALLEVLRHLVDSFAASHGMVRMVEEQNGRPVLVLRASCGFSEDFRFTHARVPADEPWVRWVLEKEQPFLSWEEAVEPELRKLMLTERLCALVPVRLPGKDTTLGLLGIGCHKPRRFRDEEVNFLVNVANLLGLTIQNLWLFEKVSNAQRQWMYTFDSITDPILVHGSDYRVLRVNRAVAERLGTEAAGLVGQPVRELLRRGDRPWTDCPYCEGADGRADGTDPTFGGYRLVSNSEFHDPDGHKLGTIHVLKDLTERRRAEQMYQRLFENVREGVFISTAEGRFIDFNYAFMRMLGYASREELLRADIASTFYVNPADRERLKHLLREHNAVNNFEYQLRRRDGEILDVTETSFATYDPVTQSQVYQGFVLDITERKRAEEELRRRNRELMVLNSIATTLSQSLQLDELLHRALEQLVGMFGADLGAVYLLEEKTGTLRRRAACGFRSEYARYFPETPVPGELIEHIRRTRATVLIAQSLPLPAVFGDLQAKEGIQVSHLVILWAKRRILGALVVASRSVREFSAAELNLLNTAGNQFAATIEKALLYEEARRAYENLRLTQEQLLQSEKMAAVGQLISGVAHELNNPLTAILGYSQLLAGSADVTPQGNEFVQKIYRQAQRTHRIVQNLLSFSRQHKPERLPVNVNQVLEDTVILREYDLKISNIRVHRDLDPALPATAGDAHQLQQVFLNILNNAVDAVLEVADRGGDIWLRTRARDGRLQIEITDSGPGISDPLRVFDPFYTTKAVGKGTGLGLSICYGIVKEHGGEIEAFNSPPRGATFRITLPVLEASPTSSAQRQALAEGLLAGRVLLVDDEPALLELEQEILRRHCASLRGASSGREALEALQQDSFDLVITDLKMPGEVTGRDLYAWVDKHRPELAPRVIFTVSDPGTADVRAFLQETGRRYLRKPFQVEQLLEVVRQVASGSKVSTVKE